MQDYDDSSGQKFNIHSVVNDDGIIEEGVYKIFSVEYPTFLVSLSMSAGDACQSNTDIVLLEEEGQDYEKWKISPGGTIENFSCSNMVIDISSYKDGDNIQSFEKNDEWGQKWTIQSSEVIIGQIMDLEDGSEKNANQTWTPRFVDVGYDLGLHPGFPGTTDTCEGQECLSSTKDRDLAKEAMRICDESMSFLVGSQLSVGTLKAIADAIEEGGADHMPGYCCMDIASNSEYFGYNVRSSLRDSLI